EARVERGPGAEPASPLPRTDAPTASFRLLGAATQEGRDLELVALVGRRWRRRCRLPALGHGRVLPATLPGGHVQLVVGDQTVAADGPPARLQPARLRPVTSYALLDALAAAGGDHPDAHAVAHRPV